MNVAHGLLASILAGQPRQRSSTCPAVATMRDGGAIKAPDWCNCFYALSFTKRRTAMLPNAAKPHLVGMPRTVTWFLIGLGVANYAIRLGGVYFLDISPSLSPEMRSIVTPDLYPWLEFRLFNYALSAAAFFMWSIAMLRELGRFLRYGKTGWRLSIIVVITVPLGIFIGIHDPPAGEGLRHMPFGLRMFSGMLGTSIALGGAAAILLDPETLTATFRRAAANR